jgi:Enolase, C-terminal TIM barrel domain
MNREQPGQRNVAASLSWMLAPDRLTPCLLVPHFNVLNGGVHAPNQLNFEEFMVAPLGAQLADIVNAVGRRQDLDSVARAEVRRWSRAVGSAARDGVPAQAFQAQPSRRPAAASAGGCGSAISIWAVAWACPWPAGRPQRPPRCWSPRATAAPTGCAPDRRCTGC